MITEPRDMTEAESTQLSDYITAQKDAGTTNGAVYVWDTVVEAIPTQNVRIWSTSESATGYQAILAGFSPAIPVTVY